MKKLALAVALAASFGSAHASGLYIDAGAISTGTFNGYNGVPETITGKFTTGLLGNLGVAKNNKVTFTYLGNESGYNDAFHFNFGSGTASLTEASSLGDSITSGLTTSGGLLDFWFTDNHGGFFANGDNPATGSLSFAILAGKKTQYGNFDYILGFNDSFSGNAADYDDFVVGVSSVPVPAALPLMASGLGLLGFAGFRRKSA